MKDQNRIALLRSLYRAGQELHRAAKEWRVGPSPMPSGAIFEGMVKVEQAVEAIAETGMFEPVSDRVAAQRLKDALAEPDEIDESSGEMFTRLGREIAEDMRAASKGKPTRPRFLESRVAHLRAALLIIANGEVDLNERTERPETWWPSAQACARDALKADDTYAAASKARS